MLNKLRHRGTTIYFSVIPSHPRNFLVLAFSLFFLPLLGLSGETSGRPQLVWQGELEGTHDLVVHKGTIQVEDISGPGVKYVQYRLTQPLPEDELTVDVDPRTSRGYVHVLQQPKMDNGFTLRIRIEDRQTWPFVYSIAATWKPPDGPDFSKASLFKSRKPAKVRDEPWATDGRRFKVTCGAIWTGAVQGSARIAIRQAQVQVLRGNPSGTLDVMSGTLWPKGAYHPLVMPTSSETRAKIVELPSAENDYTLEIDLQGDQPRMTVEIAW